MQQYHLIGGLCQQAKTSWRYFKPVVPGFWGTGQTPVTWLSCLPVYPPPGSSWHNWAGDYSQLAIVLPPDWSQG